MNPARKVESEEEPEQLRWYAVHTHAQEEHRATDHLRQQDIAVLYLWEPVELSSNYARNPFRARWAWKEGRRRPYLSRYIFAGLSAYQGLSAVNSSRGVSCVVRPPNSDPLPIPQSIMDGLFSLADEHGRVRPEVIAEEPLYHPGDEISLVDPFEGLVAIIRRVDRSGKVDIWLRSTYGRQYPATWEVKKLAQAASSQIKPLRRALNGRR